MARFFIDRPHLRVGHRDPHHGRGAISITRLPISRYPTIAPPSVTIAATLPGGLGQGRRDSVTQVIEQSMTGLDGLLYMSATSEATGVSTLTLTFDSSVNPDTAQVQVQNKLAVATPSLPQIVQQQGITVSKANPGFLMVLGFVSEDGSMDQRDIADYVKATISDPLSRVNGVGSVRVFGAATRCASGSTTGKLDTYRLSVAEVTPPSARRTRRAVGQLGGTPAIPASSSNATITGQDRLQTPEHSAPSW